MKGRPALPTAGGRPAQPTGSGPASTSRHAPESAGLHRLNALDLAVDGGFLDGRPTPRSRNDIPCTAFSLSTVEAGASHLGPAQPTGSGPALPPAARAGSAGLHRLNAGKVLQKEIYFLYLQSRKVILNTHKPPRATLPPGRFFVDFQLSRQYHANNENGKS